jgi:adenosylcobinamide-phosphate synthase
MEMILTTAFMLDIIFADPFWLYHPVQVIGNFSIFLEKQLRRIKHISLYVLGIIHWIVVVGLFIFVFLFLKDFFKNFDILLLSIFYTYLTFSFLALGALAREARTIYKFLELNEIDKARNRVQGVVSRDMSKVNEQEIVRAVIETTTENISDGIIGPLFFFALGGPLLMMIYKITNTLDSMIGYKNKKYIKFGWFSAKMDDLLNLIPARITGFLILLVALFTKDSAKRAWKAWMKDAQKGPSPNGGIPIVTYAGARNIKLGGPCEDKEGNIIPIPFVGGENSFDRKEIKKVLFYTYTTSTIMLILVLLFM